ncbi:DUF3048 domain-containing protein [Nocardioides sp. CER19]|uniref:DUF3048 domain-containing protein n=1 Tax=Nocardioides sp. CER19 TaxID=3038538 RepID=UPI002447D712|nr:DUF3048 domain-containing protein [Nocardioides sp. CER19]MDH2413988.1 DUF3048 domain-containing protein [Nocardioides sp. CER19]
MRTRTQSRFLARTLTPLLAAGLVLAGCGGGNDDNKSAAKPGASTSPTTPPPPQYWPLTGVQAPAGTSVAKNHPVFVVKIDNTDNSAPQLGLGSADMVVEELVEGAATRLAAFFYSGLPKTVGPVRSMRASDISVVSPAGATVVTSGMAGPTKARVNGAGVKFIEEGAKGFFRDNSRTSPSWYHLLDHLDQTATLAKTKAARTPKNYLPWGTEADFPAGGQAATQVDVPFGGFHTTKWAFQGGHYVNTNSYAKKGDAFAADNVLVIRAHIGDAGYLDPAGNHVPEIQLDNRSGKALLFHGGKLVRATWSKGNASSSFELKTATGPLKVPAGHTWIELVPDNGPQLTIR